MSVPGALFRIGTGVAREYQAHRARPRLDSAAAAEPGVIQWDLTDAEPWHIAVSNGSTHAAPGRVEDPRLSLRTRFEDLVDVVGGRKDPRRLVATGRLRPRGDLRWVWRSRAMFPPL